MKIKHLIVGPLLTNCYVLISDREAAVVDPGGGLKRIFQEIEKNRAKLNYIILTHYHWDHVFGALKLKEKTGAKIFIHKEEKDFIKFKPDYFLNEGEEIKIGEDSLKVVHTSGHSKGGICLLGNGFIFTGDTLFGDGVGRTDLPGGSQKDLENSLKKLEKIIKPGTKVCPGHGPVFTKP